VLAALEARRAQLLRQLASENFLLSFAGSVGGIVLAYAGLHALLSLAPPDLPRSTEITLNG
jgi:ABC-type antimicrobial peptide transport system permease subunit